MRYIFTLCFSICFLSSCTQLVPKHTISDKQISGVRNQNFGKNMFLANLGHPLHRIETKDKEIYIYSVNTEDCVEGVKGFWTVVNVMYPGLAYLIKKQQCDKSQDTTSFIFNNNELWATVPGFSEHNFFHKPDGNLGIATKCNGGTASCLQLAARICGKAGYEVLEKKVVGSNSSSNSSSISIGNASGSSSSTYSPFTRTIATTGQASGFSNTFTSVDSSTAIVEEMLFSCSK